jgi:hypothetical protein
MIDSLDDELVKARADLSERQRLLVKAQTELATHSRRQQARRSTAEHAKPTHRNRRRRCAHGVAVGAAPHLWSARRRPDRCTMVNRCTIIKAVRH